MNGIYAMSDYVDNASISRIDENRHADRAVGATAAWRHVLKRAGQVAATETIASLEGESGSGKEVIARYIHNHSPRRRGPFVAINCAALPESLLESELFGYERGAFTGAQQNKPGLFETASGGTLFLDEITEMPLAAQAKLLRVLQEREFTRLGGTRPIRTNVRIIAATNRDLFDAVAHGQFRTDLYYRINVFPIRIPPLRERRDDIPLLAASFLDELAKTMGQEPATLTPGAIEALMKHDWPGNVRELRNALERATIVCEDGTIGPEDLLLLPTPRPVSDSGTDLDAVERRAIERAMKETAGNKAKASRQLGISRTQLYIRLRKHGFEAPGPATVGA